jgi:nitroreductase
MSLQKQATPDHPIHELLAKRWSPYAFSDRPVSNDDLLSLFEAARRSRRSFGPSAVSKPLLIPNSP